MHETRRFIIAMRVLGFVTLAFACERADREPNGLPPRTHPTATGTMWAPVQRMDGGRIGEVAIRTVPTGAALHLRATSLPEGPLSIEVRSEGGCESPLDQPSGEVFRAEVEADGTADVEWAIPEPPASMFGDDGRAVVIVRPASADVACAELQIDQSEARPHGSGRPALSPTPPAMPPHSPRGEDEERF